MHVLNYASYGVGTKEGGTKGMTTQQINKFVEEVAERCLEIPCKVRRIYMRSYMGSDLLYP